MKEFINDLWFEIRHGSGIDRVSAVVLASVISVIILTICYGLFCAADSWFVGEKKATGVVVGKSHRTSWVQPIVHTSGKSTWTQIIVHPESWNVEIDVNGSTGSVSVTPSEYESAQKGDSVRVEYVNGRLSGEVYVKEAIFDAVE